MAPFGRIGKTICDATTGEGRAPHLLSLSIHNSGETLLQMRVDTKTNEIPVTRELLGRAQLHDRVFTADAMHAQAGFAQAVLDRVGHNLLLIKENQLLLDADLQERRLRVTTELAPNLRFPGVQQAMPPLPLPAVPSRPIPAGLLALSAVAFPRPIMHEP